MKKFYPVLLILSLLIGWCFYVTTNSKAAISTIDPRCNTLEHATGAVGVAETDTNGRYFSWETGRVMRFVFCQNHFNSGANLYLCINKSTCTTTNWDVVLEPGASWSGFTTVVIGQTPIVGVTIKSDATVTADEDFVLEGF